MILQCFAVLDDKAGYYGHPFFTVAAGQATRMFEDWCGDPNTPLGKHPGDYRLYRIGRFDDSTGALESMPQPEYLTSGADVVAAKVADGPRRVP